MSYKKNFGDKYFSTMSSTTDVLVQVLEYFSCNDIYGLPGDYAAPLVMALENHFNLYPSSNEMHAGFSACAAAELSGIGVCLTTYMVGSLPVTSAAALAQTECLPVVFLSGCPGEKELHKQAIHHTLTRPNDWNVDYDNAINAFKSLNIKSERLRGSRNENQPNIVGEQLFDLIRYAVVERRPVFIEVPRDLFEQKSQAFDLPRKEDLLASKFKLYSGEKEIADHIINSLQSSNNPLVFLGDKVRHNKELQSLILEFCKNNNIPFATNLFSKGIYESDFPLNIGTYNGVFSEFHTREYIEKKTDFILEIGTSIITMDLSDALGTNTYYIDSFENKICIKGSAPLESDLIELFVILNEFALKKKSPDLINETPISDSTNNENISFKNLYDIIYLTQKQIQEAFILIPEIGSAFFSSFTSRTKQAENGKSWITNPWYGAMGTSIPYARAICHILKRKKWKDIPLVIIGDGGFHFQSNDLVHFQRENLDVVIIYLNNLIFEFGKCSSSNIYHAASRKFDLEKLTQAYGGHYSKATKAKDLLLRIKNAVNEGGVQIIEVVLDTNDKEQNIVLELINIYIQTKAGKSEAKVKWDKILNNSYHVPR